MPVQPRRGCHGIYHGTQLVPQAWTLLPETRLDPKHVREQIARELIPRDQRIVSHPMQRQRNQMHEPDPLPDHETQLLDRGLADRLAPQIVAPFYQRV